MTDDQMDARLRAAGERWRAAHTTVAEPRPVAEAAPVDLAPRPPRRPRAGLLASAAVVAAALVAGGTLLLRGAGNGAGPSGDTAPLEGHVWLVQDRQDSGSSAAFYIDADGNLVADDECVLIGGKATVGNDSLTVTDRVVRYKSCTDQYGPGYYQDGVALLEGTSTYAITSDGVTISRGDKELRLALAPENTPAPTLDFPTLVGSPWKLVSAKDADGADVPVAGDPAFRIADDGTLTGSDGCNTMQGTVTVDYANAVHFGTIGGTERACPGDAGATEQVVLSVFRGTAQTVASSGELTITGDAGELRFRWDPPASGSTDPAALTGVTWHLVADSGTEIPLDTTLRIDGNTATTSEGCEYAVAVTPGTFRATGGADCGGTRTLGAFLRGTAQTWRISGGKLILFTDAQAFALVFASQSTQPPPPASDLPLPVATWHLTSIRAGGGRYREGAPPAEASTLRLTDTSFTVVHECYEQGGDLTTRGNTITIGDTSSGSGHSCPFRAGRDDAAQLVDSILTGTVTVTRSADALTITKPGVGTLTYSAAAATASVPLDGTDWQLETAVDQSGAAHTASGESLTIDNGQVAAGDGVNTISGAVQVHEGTLVFGNLATTDIGAIDSDPVTAVVDAVIAPGDAGYEVLGDALTITRGPEQLIYRAKADSGTQSISGTWHLTTIEHGSGPDGTASSASVPGYLAFDDSGTAHVSCGGQAAVDATDTAVRFGDWILGTASCPQGPIDESEFVLGQVLVGSCTYTIDGDQLTITKHGVGAVILARA